MRPVCGSTNRTTALTDRTNNKRGKLPSREAVLESTTTRSSLQASAKVTRDVYWWLNKFDFGSADTNFFVSLTRPVWKATSSALQFGVSRGVREVWLALRGRLYLSEIVSKFEPKTWPGADKPDSLVDFHTGDRRARLGRRFRS